MSDEVDTARRMDDVEKPVLDLNQEEARHVIELSKDSRVTAFTPEEERAILFRIDRRLVLTLGCLYCISLLDRTNLGAANIAGYVRNCQAPELRLTSSQACSGPENECEEQCL